jgi:DNA-binding NtrC family response regulator
LYYRLNVVTIHLPSLRERTEDIPALVHHFIKKVREESAQDIKTISPAAMKYLLAYTWPGNIRELENVIERASVLSKGSTIDVEDLTPNILEELNGLPNTAHNLKQEGDYTKRMEEFEKQLIFNALMESRGNISSAARMLGLKRTTLRYKMEKHDLLRFKFE